LISFDEFVTLMSNLGFVKYEQTTKNNDTVEMNNKFTFNANGKGNSFESLNVVNNTTINPGQDNLEKEKKKKESEYTLLKDAWKILSNANEEADNKVDTNQILVFCAAILGLYKGEEGNNPVNSELKQELVAHPVENKEENVNTKEGEKVQGKEQGQSIASPQDQNMGSTKASPTKKKNFKIPNRFSSVSEQKTYFNETGFKLNSKPTKPEEDKNKNLISVVVPELDITKYYYLKKTVKQIKAIFRHFYDTRMHFLSFEKRKARQDKQETEKKATTTTAFMPSHKLRQSADNYRRKIFDQIDSDSEQREKKETNSQSQEKQAEQVVERRKLKLEEAYEILRNPNSIFIF